ncbi:MAG: pectate lyase, partial [Bacteroidales bacterium]
MRCRKRIIRKAWLAALLAGMLPVQNMRAQSADLEDQVEKSMLRASRFMTEEVSTLGGYVWDYLPDLTRRWGEMEAYSSMIWVQPPGTPSMGQLFLDAYHA